ncbi:hypothetical protein TGMAS_237595 [Toxoplasma gondii MAS]|uniref:Uncharacterized protein n=5 Tax=Toxoplasma gondii TaxID=5811 RepID=V5B5W4_TOXGV|nr:hypothetical protein TGVEG_237595 [Toxoplasma gondii VEG]KFG44316.1 hypothetical protein TGFOU_237595 [Toxoplasma gondii FOU]KFH16333.1 hypothetical protein TGMAS_237595 [Toxoplasma gondii MAS]PUA86491.1 hypothetical protein TGBR9_237595 [Toxoplasma gondii TgCATBr9]RQX70055.1 hypothetical protein TGCAST_237595 [Toxoplasma gondii CAST]
MQEDMVDTGIMECRGSHQCRISSGYHFDSYLFIAECSYVAFQLLSESHITCKTTLQVHRFCIPKGEVIIQPHIREGEAHFLPVSCELARGPSFLGNALLSTTPRKRNQAHRSTRDKTEKTATSERETAYDYPGMYTCLCMVVARALE